METTIKKEAVNHPSHYMSGGIEVIDIIDAYNLNFSRGNAVKYLLRAGKKGNEIEDLMKCIWYVKHEIENLQKQQQKQQ